MQERECVSGCLCVSVMLVRFLEVPGPAPLGGLCAPLLRLLSSPVALMLHGGAKGEFTAFLCCFSPKKIPLREVDLDFRLQGYRR